MLHALPEKYGNVLAVFDNEEVGSSTRQGAASTFLKDTLQRICSALHINEDGYCRLLADSFMISADNAHAVHPNHPEKADPTNRPYLNGGIVIKYHGSQKYTTDGVSAAAMKDICRQADVPWQTYANRSDIAGGSTLGNLSAVQFRSARWISDCRSWRCIHLMRRQALWMWNICGRQWSAFIRDEWNRGWILVQMYKRNKEIVDFVVHLLYNIWNYTIIMKG